VAVALDPAEEEEHQRPGDPRRDAQQKVGGQQLSHRLQPEQRQIGRYSAMRRGAGIDRLRHGEKGQAERQGQGEDDGPAHDPHPVRIVAQPGLDHHRRQDQDQDHPDDVEHLPPAIDATALIVLRRQDRGPAQLRQRPDRKAEIENQQPGEQIGRRRARPHDHEHHEGGQHQDRDRYRHPRAIAAQSCARPVHAPADKRVEGDVDQPHSHEDGRHHAQLQSDMGSVELRQGYGQGDAEGRQGQTGAGKGR